MSDHAVRLTDEEREAIYVRARGGDRLNYNLCLDRIVRAHVVAALREAGDWSALVGWNALAKTVAYEFRERADRIERGDVDG